MRVLKLVGIRVDELLAVGAGPKIYSESVSICEEMHTDDMMGHPRSHL